MNYNKKFLAATSVATIIVVLEVIFGVQANSLALISDALHNAGDMFGLGLAWLGIKIAKAKPSSRFTYGLKNVTLFTAFINALLLFIAVGAIGWESIQRFHQTHHVAADVVLVIATIGLVLKLFAAALFVADSHKDINIRAAYMDMLADAGVSAGVIVSSLLIIFTGWLWVDPATSLIIMLVIIFAAWQLFKESSSMLLHAVPNHIDAIQVKKYLLSQESVLEVHDLHIWALSSTDTAISVHVLVESALDTDAFLQKIECALMDKFTINHTTIQIETDLGHRESGCGICSD